MEKECDYQIMRRKKRHFNGELDLSYFFEDMTIFPPMRIEEALAVIKEGEQGIVLLPGYEYAMRKVSTQNEANPNRP